MTIKGNPVPTTTHRKGFFKVSDGLSVRVTADGTYEAGSLVLLGGYLGFLFRDVESGDEAILSIEQAEYETDQVAFTTDERAAGEAKVDGITAKIEGGKSAAYNGIEIKFVTGEEAGGAWAENVLTLTLVAVTNYGKTELESLIAAVTTGAPTGVDVSEIAVTIASAKSGTNWATAESVVLAGGVADGEKVYDDLDVGDVVYWDADNEVLTKTKEENRIAGRITAPVDANGVIWFILGPQV